MKRREMVREKDDDRDADDSQASVNKQGCVGLRGPVVRTLLLVLNSGKKGGVVSRTLQAECVEGLLSYARLLFAQPQAGKLSILVAAGQQVQTVTSWDPGEQSVEAIVKGLAHWKATGDGGCNIKQAIQESLGALFQTSSTNGLATGIDNKATSVAPKLRKLVTMVRTRLIVVLPHDRVAGDAVHVYHKLVVEALACISMKEHDVASCHAVFLDFSSMLEPAFEPLVTSTAANGDVHLTTTYYKVLLTQALDLFLDLAYFHLELLAIAVKGMVSCLLELSEGDAATQHGINYKEMKGDKAGAIDSSTQLVVFQSSLLTNNFPTEAPPLHPISIKNARTTVLYCLKSHASTSQLLAMPCTSIAPTLPEVLQRGPSAKLWENLKNRDTGNLVLALSTDEDMNNNNITHLCVWRDGRFWLHTLGLPESRNGATSTAGNDIADELHHGDNEDSSHPNLGNMLSIAPHRKSSGHNVEKQGGSRHSTKKRKQEEMEENVQVGVAPTMRSKKSPTHGSKHLERLSQHFPGTSPDTTLGAPERHSLNLASLVATIRGAFAAEEPLTEHLNNASKCISRLLEFTEKNDLSVFPSTVDSPAVRKELYKKVWVELDSMAKQAKEKTHGQEDLANAIFAASTLEPNVIEEKVAPGLPHPVPPEKPSEYAPINKRRRCEEVPRDAHGRPVYPIKLGPSLQVYDLGKIIWNRPNFHSEKYIWPSGYKSRRAYASMLNSENRIFYRCEIVDDGQAPEFRLTPEDDQSNPVVGISATAVWTVVVKRVGALRIEEGGKKTFANVSGPEYFGYANPTIARLIQQLPNAEKCTKYRRQEYLPNVPMRTSGDTEPMHGGSTAVVPPDFSASPGHETIPHELNTSSSVSGDDSSPVQAAAAAAAAAVGQTFHQESAEGVVGPAQAEDAPPPPPPPPPLVNTAEEPCVEGVLVHSPSSTTTTTTTTTPPPCKDERLEPLSWLSEFYITRNRKGIGDFPKRFTDCNPGSLFNHYWSAKLRRLQTFELDGRK